MVVETHLHTRNYLETEVCRIINPRQQKMYIKNGAFPIDIYTSVDKDGGDIVVMIFLKNDTNELYQKWKNYELD